MFLAEKLHKTVSEILQMDEFEFTMWLAYYEIKHDEMKQRELLRKKR
jgi:hypothetical protein|tara:strand:+ start:265 stop:405 length:141 start_codon:yes stop_codon:yes gene_type:complete